MQTKQPNYHDIDYLVALIEGPNRNACRRILDDHRSLFQLVPGSTHNHQAWPGGYLDHVAETMNVAHVFYKALTTLRALPFSLSDALLILFLHDIEKPWKYELVDGRAEYRPERKLKEQARAFRDGKMAEYGIVLTEEQANAMVYVEGEIHDYTSQERKMGPLAAFCHLCDITSARIWFDQPDRDDDGWTGAARGRWLEP